GDTAAATKINLFFALNTLFSLGMLRVDGWAHDAWGTTGMLYTEALTGVAALVLFVGLARHVRGTALPERAEAAGAVHGGGRSRGRDRPHGFDARDPPSSPRRPSTPCPADPSPPGSRPPCGLRCPTDARTDRRSSRSGHPRTCRPVAARRSPRRR